MNRSRICSCDPKAPETGTRQAHESTKERKHERNCRGESCTAGSSHHAVFRVFVLSRFRVPAESLICSDASPASSIRRTETAADAKNYIPAGVQRVGLVAAEKVGVAPVEEVPDL